MNKRDNIAVVISNANAITPYETIDTVIESGFKNIFIQWYNRNWEISQEEQLDYIKRKNLNIIFAHLGYDHINDFWSEDEEIGMNLVEGYKKDFDICHKNNINLVIMHTQAKLDAPKYNEYGLKRFQELADYAQSLGLRIAIENTKLPGYLDYLIDNIKNENFGICFDVGHYHVHFKDQFDFDKFKNRIFAVHLHDNDQSDDQHLLPFDGTLDWQAALKHLKECNYNGPITLEICYRKPYLEITPKEFFDKGLKLGEKLYDMWETL